MKITIRFPFHQCGYCPALPPPAWKQSAIRWPTFLQLWLLHFRCCLSRFIVPPRVPLNDFMSACSAMTIASRALTDSAPPAGFFPSCLVIDTGMETCAGTGHG